MSGHITSVNTSDGFHKRLSTERKRLSLTQMQLANLLGLSRNSIAQYEAGNYQPAIEILARMSSIGVDVMFLLTGISADPDRDQINVKRLAMALQEARRQLHLPMDSIDQQQVADRVWIIYRALDSFHQA
jgi:transcriptional regulator with XRE-family HTH domain